MVLFFVICHFCWESDHGVVKYISHTSCIIPPRHGNQQVLPCVPDTSAFMRECSPSMAWRRGIVAMPAQSLVYSAFVPCARVLNLRCVALGGRCEGIPRGSLCLKMSRDADTQAFGDSSPDCDMPKMHVHPVSLCLEETERWLIQPLIAFRPRHLQLRLRCVFLTVPRVPPNWLPVYGAQKEPYLTIKFRRARSDFFYGQRKSFYEAKGPNAHLNNAAGSCPNELGCVLPWVIFCRIILICIRQIITRLTQRQMKSPNFWSSVKMV